MNRYIVYFRNKKNGFYDAFSYSESGEKYVFHKKEDKSDSESFAFKADVMGIEIQGDGSPLSVIMA